MRSVFLTLLGVLIVIAGWSPIGSAETKRPRNRTRASDRQPIHATVGESSTDSPTRPASPAKPKSETAIFGGGCFWCTEFAFEQLAGVINAESGYCGGTRATAHYDKVHLGNTRHAEAIRVTYDPDIVTYDELLDVFFSAHDPTQLNRQGDVDVGRQYRSVIFFASDEQQERAKAKIADLESKRVYKRRIVTKLEPLKEFYPAEDIHQDFARKNPYMPYVQEHAAPKAAQIRMKYPDLIRDVE